MNKRSGIVTLMVLMFLIMAAFTNVVLVMPVSEAPNNVKNTFGDGSTDLIIDFPGTGTKTVVVPADANVTKATVNFTTTANDDGIYPENIELRFGEVLPIDWAYQGSGHGAFGYQRYFKDSQVRVNLTHDGDQHNDTLSFILPKDADISQASVKMTGFEYDHWADTITELNIADTQTWQQDPYLYVFQNRLWCFVRNYNSTETDESDGDISYTYTTDGVNWQPMTELTPNGDTPDGYPGTGPTHIAGDFHPVAIEFDGKMGVFWGSMSFNNIPSTPWGGITNGSDRDIVVRWYDPSTGWGPYIEITHPTDNANESNYTRNTGDDPDPDGGSIEPWHKDDRRPNVAVFNNKIYVIWTANNTGNTTFHMHEYNAPEGEIHPWWNWNHRGDIMISSSDDGIDWTHGVDLTAGDRWWDIDFAPSLHVWDNKLFAIWETNGPRYVNESGNWVKRVDVQTKYDWDIVYRYTEDGVNWSDFIEITQKNDTPPGTTGAKNAIPDEDPRLIAYTDPVTQENRLYCIYRTRNPTITNGTDYDIVITYTTDGENWTLPLELTDPVKNGGYDNKPELTYFLGKLYVVYRREQGERWADNPDGDILTRHWNGEEWSVEQYVSPFDGDGSGRDDFYPNSVSFGNRFYTAWVTRNRGPDWTEGTDGDVVVRSMLPSDFPIVTGLDVGDDRTWEVPEYTELTKASPSMTVDLTSRLRAMLLNQSYVNSHTIEDDFGNEFVEFPLNVMIRDPGRVRFDNLKIWYNMTASVGDGETYNSDVDENPFADKLNNYIKSHQKEADSNGDIEIKLEVTSPNVGRIKMHNLYLEYNHEPTFEILTPSENILRIEKTLSSKVEITWNDFDVDDDAEISLYYHRGKFKTYEGELIVENIKENDLLNSYEWEFTEAEVSDGVYSIFGIITDGVNVIYSYAPGLLDLTWEHPPPPWIKITEPNGKGDKVWESFRIEWDDSGKDTGNEQSGAYIYLYYSTSIIENISGIVYANQIDINGDGQRNTDDYIYENEDGGKGEYIWDISHLDEGTSYYISGVIDDGVNDEGFDCSEHRLIRDHIFPPNDFSVANGDMISEPLNVWNTHNTRPQLSWNMFTTNYIFFITVWEGNDNNGTKIFEAFNVTEFNIDIDPETGRLEYGKTYFAEIFAQSYTGGISGTATITINIINTKPAPPTVNFSPQKPTSTNALICLEPPEKLDDDGDIITYSYRWYKDDDPQEEFNDIRTIPPEKLVKGDEWTVEVIPNDGIENGLSTMSYITIWNTLPEISIENPSKSDEYYSNTKINVYGTAVDADGDTITVEWYLDIDDPNNVSKLALGTEDPIMSGGEEALSFESKFSKGKHNLTLFVRDGDVGKDFSLGVVKTISFDVVGPDPSADGGKDGEDVTTSVAIGSILAIIIVVVILILFLQMRKRKPKSEREQLYGKDQGLKPGEAYPVEDDESYFGDELDRKGVSSFDSPPPAPPQTPAPTKKEEVTGAEKPPQLPPPESKKE